MAGEVDFACLGDELAAVSSAPNEGTGALAARIDPRREGRGDPAPVPRIVSLFFPPPGGQALLRLQPARGGAIGGRCGTAPGAA
jgi:hypothetical protein